MENDGGFPVVSSENLEQQPQLTECSEPEEVSQSKRRSDYSCRICLGLVRCKMGKFIASADSGKCPTCEMLRHGLSLVLDLHRTRIKKWKIEFWFRETVSVRTYDKAGRKRKTFEFYLSSSSVEIPKGIPWPKTARDVPRSLEGSLRLARSWLDNCRETHIQCPAVVIDSLPKRILQLGDNDQDIRLLETTDEQGGYAALSYCWGQTGNVTTTRDSLAGRLKKIDPKEVPKTILDAIHITRSLGLRYLWVDSLCIIQNDNADWHEQSSLMGDIYANAAVVIAAHSSRHAHGGCLWTDHLRVKALASFDAILDGKTVTISIRQDPKFYGQTPAHGVELELQSELESRGWTLQETMLAKRILHCTRSEMAWQCSHLMCECRTKSTVPMGEFSDSFTKLLGRGNNPPSNASIEDSYSRPLEDSNPSELLHKEWRRLVGLYTRRTFTFPEKDKLPALAGIASTLSKAAPDVFPKSHYLFGLWRTSLVNDLLWCNDEIRLNEPPVRRLSSEIVPSWSWASLRHGLVCYHPMFMDEFRQLCQVENVVCSPKSTQDVFGSTGSGRIEILAEVKQISLEDGKIENWSIRLDTPLNVDLSGPFYAMVLGSLIRSWGKGEETTPRGLVLVESRFREGSFERVGYFEGPKLTRFNDGSKRGGRIRGERRRVILI
ncbi:heterokaryon incompatibility protein [Naviculisporaceae sp. PSN 640]